MKRKKTKMLIVLAVLLLGITVGYAILTSNLNINGTSTINNPTWDIHFENVLVKNGSVTATTPATINEARNTVTYAVALNTPGEFYEFTVDAKNAGTIDGMIESVTSTVNNQPISNLPSYIEYYVTYEDGTEILNNHLLAKNTKETYKVHIGYKKDIDISELPDTSQTLNLSFGVISKQADDNAEEVIHSVSFAEDDWSTIAAAVRNGKTDKYNVGDTKEIDMGEFGTHTVRIANMSTPSECSTEGFSQTACGFVIEFADILISHAMNSEASNIGGWPASEMRTYLNNTIYNSLPTEIKNKVINTTVVSSHGTKDNSNFLSTDKLYLLSSHEVWVDIDGDSSKGVDYYDTSYSRTRQLDYYEENNVTSSNYSAAIKKYNDSAHYWWLRSARSDYYYSFARVNSSGSHDGMSSWGNNGVSPAFRIG